MQRIDKLAAKGQADAAANGTYQERPRLDADTSDGGFDFRLDPAVQSFRDEVRAFLGEHVTDR